MHFGRAVMPRMLMSIISMTAGTIPI